MIPGRWCRRKLLCVLRARQEAAEIIRFRCCEKMRHRAERAAVGVPHRGPLHDRRLRRLRRRG